MSKKKASSMPALSRKKKGPAPKGEFMNQDGMNNLFEKSLKTVAGLADQTANLTDSSSDVNSLRSSRPPSNVSKASTKQAKLEHIKRDSLFDVYDCPDYYPLHKIKDVVTIIQDKAKSGELDLDFTGVEQLTDIVFAIFMVNHDLSKFSSVHTINLTGCLHLTDVSMAWISVTFKNLKKIVLAGCHKITEAGIQVLAKNCKGLQELDLTGTTVSVVPIAVADLEVKLDGCPLVSPDRKIVEQEGGTLRILKAPQYKKPDNKDIIKICVVRGNEMKHSFIKYLMGEKDLSVTPVLVKEYKLNAKSVDITAHVIECDQLSMDLFVTKRTLVVLPYEADSGQTVDSIVSDLAALIFQIISKVDGAVFIVAGMSKGKLKIPDTKVKDAIENLIKSSKSKLQSFVNNFIKAQNKLEGIGFQEQQEYGRAYSLLEKLQYVKILSFGVDLDKSKKEQSVIDETITKGSQMVIEFNPEFQDLGSPIFNYASSDVVPKMLKEGVLSMQEAKATNQFTMQIIEVLGRAICLELPGEGKMILSPTWIANVLSVALSRPPGGTTNDATINFVSDSQMMWKMEELQQVLQSKLPKDQVPATQAIAVLIKLGMGFSSSSYYIPFNLLDEKPAIPLDEALQINMKNKLNATYRYQFSHLVSYSVMSMIQALSNQIRRPLLLWKYGIVQQEGLVDVVIELKSKQDESCIELKAQTPYQSLHGVPQSESVEMLWQALEQYKLVVDFVLKYLNMWSQVSCTSDKPKPDFVWGFVIKHKMDVGPGEGEQKPEMCTRCGLNSTACRILSIMYEYLYVQRIEEEIIKDKDEIFGKSGNILFRSHRKSEDKTEETNGCVLKTTLNPYESSNIRFTILDGLPDNISFGIKTSDSSVNIGISFKDKSLKMFNSHSETKDNVMPLPPDISATAVGNCFEFRFDTSKEVKNGKHLWELQIYRGVELMSKFVMPPGYYNPFLSVEQIKTTTDAMASVMIHGSLTKMSKITDVVVGMRCEALDRLNPSLVCAATIQDIDENGRFLIHFDGWTSRYDYWTEPETPDIHPIGYMVAVGHKNRNYQPELQAPKGYREAFKWPRYCEQMQCLPVPYEFFSDEQKEGAPPDQENEVLEYLNAGVGKSTASNVMPCGRAKNCAKAVEFEAMKKCTIMKELVDFFTSHNKHFCLLPNNLTADDIRFPLVNKISGSPNQKIHFLCSGNKMELLHFVDDTGLDLSTYSTSASSLAPFLEMCYIGLILQEDVMPVGVKKVIVGLPDYSIEDEAQNNRVELCMKKVCFQYLMQMIVYNSKLQAAQQKTKYAETQMMLQKISEDSAAIERLADVFHGIQGSGVIKCQSHNLAMSSGKEMKSINEDIFQMSYHLMQKLDFQNNALESIPEGFLYKFIKLEELNLSNNSLTQLPLGLAKSRILSHLQIANNKIKEIPDSFEALKDTLIVLDISGNPLENLPKFIFKLTGLRELRADNIGRINMTGIGALQELEILSLSYNVIESVPDELGTLPLVELNLAGVPWFPHLVSGNIKSQPTYPAFKNILSAYNVFAIMKEDSLQGMYKNLDKDSSGTLQKTELIDMNNQIFETYPRFGQKTLSNQKYGGIPEPIFKLTKLEKLDLSFHGLTQITEAIKVFESLRSLELSHNPMLESLAGELGGMPLKELHLKGCISMKTPPKEVVARGFTAVYGYLKRLQLGSVACRRTKLMMVGLGGAGKTSLVRALTSTNYRSYMDYGEQITDGIDITQWNVNVPSGGDITYSVWDFAGQTVYYNTHQFFLSNRAVYLLLWNIRLGYEHAGLDFWLSSVACHAPKAPILVVGTHCDKVKKSKIPTDELKKRFPQIAGFHFVSSYTGEGIGQLKKNLLEDTLKQKYMGERIPEAWLRLETLVVNFRDEKNLDLLPWTQVEKTAHTVGIFDDMELIQAVQFLHDLGSVQFFNTDFLRSHVVIYPQWIVDVMACIVTVHEGPIKEGKLLHENMKVIWEKYEEALHPWLLRLTEEFDLTFPLVDEPANLVPCLLPTEEPQYTWPTLEPDSLHRESKMIYKFVYLPAGLFNRAQVRLNQFSEGGLIWKKGSFLKKGGHIAIMLQSGPTEVVVKAQGFKPENLLFLCHEVFETLIAEAYSGVQYEFLIPCLECQNMNVNEPSMFSSTKIHRATELSAPFLQCDNLFHTLSIPELKAVMPPEKTENLDDHLRRSVQELQDLGEDINLNIFFCYTKKNVPDLSNENKQVHPGTLMEDLRSSGFSISFTDTPETADLEMLTLSFKSAKVVLIGMSDEFCQDETCKKLLMFVRDTLRKPILLVLLGETKEWKKSSIGMNLGNEVYVKMQDINKYDTRLKELKEAITKKCAKPEQAEAEFPRCFISYCWMNSEDAVSKGTSRKDEALGWADPRKIKDFIQERGIPCWLDIERVGGGGLFEDIADGLRKAKLVVACVSDEYAQSRNCSMEFRFALSQLRIPVVLAVVGTGYAWERSEIGMLAVGSSCPKVNLQHPNQAGLEEIYKLIQENLPDDIVVKSNPEKVEAQRKAAFQEAIELSQRQFLRHVTSYADSMYSSHYPRLIVVDMAEKPKTAEELEMEEEEKYVKKKLLAAAKLQAAKEKGDTTGTEGDKSDSKGSEHPEKCEKDENNLCGEIEDDAEEEEKTEIKVGQKYCWRLLCEHEQGWHEVSPSIPFPDLESGEEESYLAQIAPYAARIFALLKYTNLKLDSLNTPEGKRLLEKLESYASEANKSDFEEEYCSVRTDVMEADQARVMGNLKRCHMMSGKTLWLCEEHQQGSGSKTEERFKSQLMANNADNTQQEIQEEPASSLRPKTPRNPDNQPGRPTHKDSRTTHEASLFKMRESKGKSPGKMKRQTSQACSVM